MTEWSGTTYNGVTFWGLDTTNDSTDFQKPNSKPVNSTSLDDCILKCNNVQGCNSVTFDKTSKLCYTKYWRYAGQLKHKKQGTGDSNNDRVAVNDSNFDSKFRYPVDTINAATTTVNITDESKMYEIGGRTVGTTGGKWDFALDGVWGGDPFEMPGPNYARDTKLKAIRTVKGFTQVCPEIGELGDVEIMADETVTNGNYYKAKCVYNKINNSTAWETLTDTFRTSASELKKARRLWCGMVNPPDKGVSFENIIRNQQCTGSEMINDGVDWKLILLGYINQTPNWYKDDTWCGRFSRLIKDPRDPVLDDSNHGAAITACLDPVKTDTSAWTSSFKTALNAITNTDTVPGFIKDKIKELIDAHCNSLPNGGKDATECGCRNAVKGWKSDPKSCDSTIEGCTDVSDWINTIKTLSGGGADGNQYASQISLGYNVRANSQACKNSETDSSGILAYGAKETGQALNIQVCNQSLQATEGGVIKVANVDFSCIQGLENKTSTSTPPDDGTPDGTPSNGTPYWNLYTSKILGLPAWLFFVILAIIIIAMIVAGFFLFV